MIRPKMCPICGTEPVGRQKKTCSSACGYTLRKQSVKPRPCAQCGQSFRPYLSAIGRGAKYCSRTCYRAAVGVRPAMLLVSCPQCGTGFRRTRAAIARVRLSFCSLTCATTHNSGERSGVWRGGSDPNRGHGWVKLAEEIRERDGYRCRRCGKTQDDNKQRLSVDHIIPWRSFTDEAEANDPSNLVAVCRSCHSVKARAERLWLQGDVLDMWRYQVAVAEPWRATA